jgi:hypothetical protein
MLFDLLQSQKMTLLDKSRLANISLVLLFP